MMTRQVTTNLTYEGEILNFITYRCAPANDFWVIWIPGSGEWGALNGSQITKIEIAGFPKFAKAGTDYPFNIIAFQGPKKTTNNNTEWGNGLREKLGKYVKVVLGASHIVQCGWSQGGMESVSRLWLNADNYYNAIINFAGNKPVLPDVPNSMNWDLASDIKVAFVHGDKDTSTSIWESYQMFDALKARTRTSNPPLFVKIPNGTHSDAPQKGCNPNDPFGVQVMTFINTIFAIPNIPEEVVDIEITRGKVLFKTNTGKIYQTPVEEI